MTFISLKSTSGLNQKENITNICCAIHKAVVMLCLVIENLRNYVRKKEKKLCLYVILKLCYLFQNFHIKSK